MMPIWVLVAVAMLTCVVLAASKVLDLFARSATSKREAMEEFYKFSNAIYDNASVPVPVEISGVLQFMSRNMSKRKYVRFAVSALHGGRRENLSKGSDLRTALSSLNEKQVEYLFKAMVSSAIVSAESSFILGWVHKEMLFYALSNPPEKREAKERFRRFEAGTAALRASEKHQCDDLLPA